MRSSATRRVLLLVALCLAWSVAATAGPFRFELEAATPATYARPHDIVLSPDGESLFVADNHNHRIAVLDPRTLAERGTFGEGEVREPHDVAFDPDGRLLVADTGNDRIAIYEVDGATGRLVDELRGRLRRPEGVAAHPDGRVFATGAASGNLVVYRDGAVVGETGGLSAPHDVAFDADGAAWIADAGNHRMVRVDAAYAIDRILEGERYGFAGPRYQDFDAAGRMFVADKYNHAIKVIAPDGTLLQVLGGARGLGEGVFNQPEGVEIRGDQVWFADTYNDRIVRYRVAGPR
ncbi:MAG: NHL repeat-containing protein [Gammaproteobacteria bacterium]|nr:NHL repeat-containing protein [Gammaproteobacteria bacterium]